MNVLHNDGFDVVMVNLRMSAASDGIDFSSTGIANYESYIKLQLTRVGLELG